MPASDEATLIAQLTDAQRRGTHGVDAAACANGEFDLV
jgi:hypothetical protein